MITTYPWDADFNTVLPTNDPAGLESFNETLTQGAVPQPRLATFKPFNIVVEQGLLYATIYVDEALDGSIRAQQIAIWLAGLKETDQIHLTITSLVSDVPFFFMIDLLAAFASTKAKIDIHLDQIVFDTLGYFYLLADKITVGSAGALFLPSYVSQRTQDMSGPWRAQHDFYKWIVDNAKERGLLTAEEADKLHRGTHATIPVDRFNKPAS